MLDKKSLQEIYARKSICFGCEHSKPKDLKIRRFKKED